MLFRSHQSGFAVKVLAPTNKAVRVLTEKLRASGLRGAETKTVYSDLYEEPEGKTDMVWESKGLDDGTLFIIDESSLIDKSLLGDLQEAVRAAAGSKIIFMGDDGQLDPVGKPSYVLNAAKSPLPSAYRVQLMGVMRQAADSTVLTAATKTRETGRPFEIGRAHV